MGLLDRKSRGRRRQSSSPSSTSDTLSTPSAAEQSTPNHEPSSSSLTSPSSSNISDLFSRAYLSPNRTASAPSPPADAAVALPQLYGHAHDVPHHQRPLSSTGPPFGGPPQQPRTMPSKKPPGSPAAQYIQHARRRVASPTIQSPRPGGSDAAQAADLALVCKKEKDQREPKYPNTRGETSRFNKGGGAWPKPDPNVRPSDALLPVQIKMTESAAVGADANSETRKMKVWQKILTPDEATTRMASELRQKPTMFRPPSDWVHGRTNRPQWRRHRALIISVRYRWTRAMRELKGTNNDMREMFRVLVDRLGFAPGNIRVLCEGELAVAGPEAERRVAQPTKKNIMEGLSWLVDGMREGDSGFFFFAGHGEETRDTSGDEISGFDQVIIPCDFATAGHLKDDDMHKLMVRRVPRGARMTAVVDACHAGSVLDLPVEYWYRESVKQYMPDSVKETVEDHSGSSSRARLALWDKAPKCLVDGVDEIGEVVLFSGSSDMQNAADAPVRDKKTWMGVFTYCFAHQVNKLYPSVHHGGLCYGPCENVTFGDLMDEVKKGVGARLIECFPTTGSEHIQIPQISSSYVFDPYATPFGI